MADSQDKSSEYMAGYAVGEIVTWLSKIVDLLEEVGDSTASLAGDAAIWTAAAAKG